MMDGRDQAPRPPARSAGAAGLIVLGEELAAELAVDPAQLVSGPQGLHAGDVMRRDVALRQLNLGLPQPGGGVA